MKWVAWNGAQSVLLLILCLYLFILEQQQQKKSVLNKV
jgi:hypothetical protein